MVSHKLYGWVRLCVLSAALWLGAGALGSAAVVFEHIVQPGENLTAIAGAYGTSVERLLELNALKNPNLIRVGQRLVVSLEPQVHVVRPGETLSEIAVMYGVKPDQLASWNGVRDPNRIVVGQELIVAPLALQHRVQKGESVGVIAQRYGVTVASIAELNNLRNPDLLRVGQVLLIPPTGGAVVEALASSRGLALRPSFTRWPVTGTITSRFGPRGGSPHEGVDIAVPQGTVVRAVEAGRVTYAGWAGTYGILVTIDHGGGLETRYAHNSRVSVKVGDWVEAGAEIARSGSTGRSTGPHVHFEVRVGGDAVDPLPWLP